MLETRGVPILKEGEAAQLMQGLAPGDAGSGVLQAWWAGEPVEPNTLYAALNVGARVAARTTEAEKLIDVACGRLAKAFPEEAFMRGRARV
jgi:hypothetical protein